jgi:hypothetical protein
MSLTMASSAWAACAIRADVLPLLGGEPGNERELRHADDRGHRRADLMAHVRQEVGLRLRGRFRFRFGGGQLPHQLRHALGVLRLAFVGQLPVGHVAPGGADQLILEQRDGSPRKPPIRSVAAAKTVLEVNQVRAQLELAGLARARVAIVRMDELEEGFGAQLRRRETQRARPRGAEPLEIAVEPGEAEQIERQGEEPIELLLRRGGAP